MVCIFWEAQLGLLAAIEATFETLFALAVAAAICVGVISLSVHLNEARSAHGPVAEMAQAAAATGPSSVPGAASASNLN
jgi:signal transduction histidine kinase